jgi:hypothetical protein
MPVLLMTWKKARDPRLLLGAGSGFLRAVWLDIAQRVCQAKGYFTCTICGENYEKKRTDTKKRTYTPRFNQVKYCSEECEKIGRKLAKARERARKRAAQAGGDAAGTIEQSS